MRRANIIRTADGTELFYRDWGSGTPVVFLAGWALASDFWSYQMAPLCEAGFRCIAYDRRGHGRSSDPGTGYDYDTLADDLAAVLDALHLSDVQVVAHSMSAGEVIRCVSKRQALGIKRIALIGPTLPCLAKSPDNPEGVDRALLNETRRQILKRGFPAWIAANGRPFVNPDSPPEMITWVKDMMLDCSMKAIIDCNRAMIEADFRAELARTHIPTLVIHGDRDASMPIELTSRRIVQLMPDVQLNVYENAPHGLPITHAARLNRDLEIFLRSPPLSLPVAARRSA